MKVIGIIMILVGIFGIFYTIQGSQKGQIVSYSGDGGSGWELRKGDPEFDKEIRYGYIGGVIMVGLGVAFLFVKSKDNDEEEN